MTFEGGQSLESVLQHDAHLHLDIQLPHGVFNHLHAFKLIQKSPALTQGALGGERREYRGGQADKVTSKRIKTQSMDGYGKQRLSPTNIVMHLHILLHALKLLGMRFLGPESRRSRQLHFRLQVSAPKKDACTAQAA